MKLYHICIDFSYGKNEMAKPKTKSFLRLWFEAFLDTTLIILLVLAIISLIIALAVEHGENLSWLDGTAILVTVIVVTRLFMLFLRINPKFYIILYFKIIFSCLFNQHMVTRTTVSKTEWETKGQDNSCNAKRLANANQHLWPYGI